MTTAIICSLVAFAVFIYFFANTVYQAGCDRGYKRGWRDCLETNGGEVE